MFTSGLMSSECRRVLLKLTDYCEWRFPTRGIQIVLVTVSQYSCHKESDAAPKDSTLCQTSLQLRLSLTTRTGHSRRHLHSARVSNTAFGSIHEGSSHVLGQGDRMPNRHKGNVEFPGQIALSRKVEKLSLPPGKNLWQQASRQRM